MSYIVGSSGLGVSLPGLDISLTSPQELVDALKRIPGPFRVSVRPDGTPDVQNTQTGQSLTPEQIKALIEQARAEGAAGAKSALPAWALPVGIAAAVLLFMRR